MSEDNSLNHPWTIYEKEATSAYTKYDIYYSELHRLSNFVSELGFNITNLKENEYQLTNFIIGTPMEYGLIKKICSAYYIFQWQQLFPKHINDFIEQYSTTDNKVNINIVIISPDDIFMDECYNEPLFTSMCEDYHFEKIRNREYICTSGNTIIKVDIFTCPFPQLETRKDVIRRINQFVKNDLCETLISDYSPTENDIKFIDNFYFKMDAIASNALSNLIINSYATFRNVCGYENYGLFPSLLELANKYKIIATEWTFQEDNIKNRIVSRLKYTIDYINYFVSYVEPCYTTNLIREYCDIGVTELRRKDSNKICILIKFPYYEMIYQKIIFM